jgi:carbonic anhydrase
LLTFKLKNLEFPSNLKSWTEKNFFVYKGTLTRPGCFADYTWVVLQNPVIVPKNQVRYVDSIFSDISKS